jgi:hypothetical protein
MGSLKLVCLQLGEGSLFLVEIDGSRTVVELKETIRRQHEKEKVLQLILAKDENGGWVGDETDLGEQLMQGEIPPGVEEILNGDEQILPTETVTLAGDEPLVAAVVRSSPRAGFLCAS